MEEDAEPVPTEGIGELAEAVATRPKSGFMWDVVAWDPPRDLYLSLMIGSGGVRSSGSVRLRFDDEVQFEHLHEAYRSLTERPSIDILSLSAGVDFHLRQEQASALDAQLRRRPTIGWRNWLRRPDGGSVDLDLPNWVRLDDHGSHVEVVLGVDPWQLDPVDVVPVRDALLDAGFMLG